MRLAYGARYQTRTGNATLEGSNVTITLIVHKWGDFKVHAPSMDLQQAKDVEKSRHNAIILL